MMTKHSQLRMKQRMGYRGAAAERIVNNAMERGYTAETAPTSWQQNYLQRKASPGYSVVLYQDRCFVFAEQKCITVIDTPHYLERNHLYRNKKQIRNPRQYFKMYGFPDEWRMENEKEIVS